MLYFSILRGKGDGRGGGGGGGRGGGAFSHYRLNAFIIQSWNKVPLPKIV